jgi:hypothetical protein
MVQYIRWLFATRRARLLADRQIQAGADRIASKPRRVKRREVLASTK